jgi:membrane protease YdiL (CAAX protease family)
VVAVIAALIAAHFHTLRLRGGLTWVVENFWLYAVWSGVQQFLLQCFFLLRILRLIPDKRLAALTAAGLFALAHLPNPILVSATIVWGIVACLVFLRYRNLYPLALAHAILGIMIAVTIPGTVDHNMRVGRGYLMYNPHRVYEHSHWKHGAD